jgi:urease accessory protein
VTGSQLDLSFARLGRQTRLARRHVSYPFHVTAPLRPAGPQAQVVVQSVSGGFFGGEVIGQTIMVGAGGDASIEFPSAAVVHAAGGKEAPRQTVALQIGAGASLAYLPRPVILFPGSALAQVMDVTLGSGATLMMRDGFMMHDPQGMAPASRRLESRVTVKRDSGRILALDRMQVADAMIDAGLPGHTKGFRAFGSLWLIRELDVPALKTIVADAFDADPACYVAITALRDGGGALVRVAARDGGSLDAAMSTLQGLFKA